MRLRAVYILVCVALFISARAVTVNIPLLEDVAAAADKERTLNENLTEGWQARNLRFFVL